MAQQVDARFERLRKMILQSGNESIMYEHWNSHVAEYRMERELDLSIVPGEILLANRVRAKLNSLKFTLTPDEGMIGRVLKPEYTPEEEKAAAEYFAASPWGCSEGQTGHAEPFYDDIFELGIEGLRRKIRNAGNENEMVYETFLIALDGFAGMIANAAEAARRSGNERIAAVCTKLTSAPPETFQEAIQLMWFIMLGIQIGDRAGLVGPGRIDRRLGGFYERDLAAGKITRAEACEYIALLYCFINALCGSGLAYAVMVGGDTVNDISYLALEALRLSRLVYPSVGICANASTPKDLKRLAVEIISEGLPNPAFFNDDVIRAGLRRYGVPEAECGNYINSTCVEITPCGASNVYVASPYFNLCGCLIETMKNHQDASDFETFLNLYLDRLSEKIRTAASDQNRIRLLRSARMRRPLQSIFTRDCIARGLDIESGGARYNWVECSFVGLANLVDSLQVIRHEVFEEKLLTMQELNSLCENDFRGREDLRLRFLNAHPKYGVASEEADSLIPLVIERLESECARYRFHPDRAHFIPGTFCWVMHQLLGSETEATPDGRRAKFPFADGAGPAQGREKLGPTAAVRSVCSWDHSGLIGGSAFNMKYNQALLKTPENREKLLALIDVFLAGGGFETQINVADNSQLKKAVEHPEDYADLVVRIGGYTDYFVKLSPEMQQELLLRTEYAEL